MSFAETTYVRFGQSFHQPNAGGVLPENASRKPIWCAKAGETNLLDECGPPQNRAGKALIRDPVLARVGGFG